MTKGKKGKDATPLSPEIGFIPAEEPEEKGSELHTIEEESKKQKLPKQEQVFSIARRVRSRLTHVPDPVHPPLGFAPGRGFDVVFPFIRLPELKPTLNGDWVQFGSPELEPNLLYWGDNLQVLRTLPTESIDLIYIDPPFFSGEQYNVIWGDANEVRTFNDIWDGGIDTYLIWLNARLWEMRRVLKRTGSIYVHCDWHASHYIKMEMDKIFGHDNFVSEVIWQRTAARSDSRRINHIHDMILLYSAGLNPTWNKVYTEYSEDYVSKFYRYEDLTSGKRFRASDLTAAGVRHGESGMPWRGIDPSKKGRHWAVPSLAFEILGVKKGNMTVQQMLDLLDSNGFIHWPQKKGGIPQFKRYLDNMPGTPLQSIWTDIPPVSPHALERIGYPTQKPESLLERIIQASSNEGDTVADFFCGGGTTCAVAMKLNRRFLGCDSSRVAVAVTLNRLVKICEEQSGVKSNYGKPGEVAFQEKLDLVKAEVPDIRVFYVGVYPMDRFQAVSQADFNRFILQCYDTRLDTTDEPITGWRGALEPVFVGPVDPEAAPEARQVKDFFETCLKHLRPNTKMKAKVLAWKFSPELNEYRRRLLNYISTNLAPRGVAMELDYIPINSQEFRERIIRRYPEASESEFFLRFTQPPIIGDIAYKKVGSSKYRFEAVDAYSTNLDGYLVNCQWDFDYQRGHFAADPKHVLGRCESKGKKAREAGRKFEAVLSAEYSFPESGQHTVACRVQDNLGGETIKSITLDVED